MRGVFNVFEVNRYVLGGPHRDAWLRILEGR